MKLRVGENKNPVKLGFLVTLVAIILAPAWAYADTYPYFNISAGGVFAGGGFNGSPSSVCSGTAPKDLDYHSPTYSGGNLSSGAKDGGVLAYGSAGAGSHSDLASLALGLIESNTSGTPSLNFSTGMANNNALDFANDLTGSPPYSTNFGGGLFSGGTSTNYCIYDYYDAVQNSPSSGAACSIGATIPNQAQCIYGTGPGSVTTINATSMPTSQHTTLFVNGNLYIAGNITYAGYGTDGSVTPATKLAVVVKGNIFIAPGVTTLNGLYIAQPISTSDQQSGMIWTCHDNNPANLSLDLNTYIKPNCNGATPLTVNGAFIAEQVVLDRLTGSTANFSGTAAEIFNFTNDMSLGGPFFTGSGGGTSSTIDSLVSLPPVF